MPFCMLSFKEKFCTSNGCGSFWEWQWGLALASLEEDATFEETQERSLWKFVLVVLRKKETRYVLSAVGQEDEYSGQCLGADKHDWRSYVIRILLAFADLRRRPLCSGKVTMNHFLLKFDGPDGMWSISCKGLVQWIERARFLSMLGASLFPDSLEA